MKSEVIASMFTGTSFNICLVRVAERVSLADQPASFSVETMNGERVTVSSAPVFVDAAVGAVWAGRADGRRPTARTDERRRRSQRCGRTGMFIGRVLTGTD